MNSIIKLIKQLHQTKTAQAEKNHKAVQIWIYSNTDCSCGVYRTINDVHRPNKLNCKPFKMLACDWRSMYYLQNKIYFIGSSKSIIILFRFYIVCTRFSFQFYNTNFTNLKFIFSYLHQKQHFPSRIQPWIKQTTETNAKLPMLIIFFIILSYFLDDLMFFYKTILKTTVYFILPTHFVSTKHKNNPYYCIALYAAQKIFDAPL